MKAKSPKLKGFVKKWDTLRISIRAVLPLFLLLSFGLMVGGAAALPAERDFRSFYREWEPSLTNEEMDVLDKAKSYVAANIDGGLAVDTIVNESFLLSYISSLQISSYTLSNLSSIVEIGLLFGDFIYPSENFLDTVSRYITIVNSNSNNLSDILLSVQGTEGYIYFTNNITSKISFINRGTFRIQRGVSTTSIIDYINSQVEAVYPTLDNLADYTRRNNSVATTSASDFSTIIENSENFQVAAGTIIILALESWSTYQTSRNIHISLTSIGTIFLLGGISYLGYIFFYIQKRKNKEKKEEA